MSQDEKPSGKFPASSSGGGLKADEAPESLPKTSHKVIADIHSGMVMVAPVSTILEDDEEGEPEAEQTEDDGKEKN
jgi:hypothetical protein